MTEYTLTMNETVELMLARHGKEQTLRLMEHMGTHEGTAYDEATGTMYTAEEGDAVTIHEDDYMVVNHRADGVESWSTDNLFEALEKRDSVLARDPEADVEVWPLVQGWTGLDADNVALEHPLASSPADSDGAYVLWVYENEEEAEREESLYNCLVFNSEDAKTIKAYEECVVELVEYRGDLETWFTGDWLDWLGETVYSVSTLPEGWSKVTVKLLEELMDDWYEPWDIEESDRDFFRTEPDEALRLFIENELEANPAHCDYENIRNRAYALQQTVSR